MQKSNNPTFEVVLGVFGEVARDHFSESERLGTCAKNCSLHKRIENMTTEQLSGVELIAEFISTKYFLAEKLLSSFAEKTVEQVSERQKIEHELATSLAVHARKELKRRRVFGGRNQNKRG